MARFSKKNDPAVLLRDATIEDAETILKWRQNTEIRRHFRNTEPIGADAHMAWMKKRICDPENLLKIIEASGMPAGTLRLDLIDPQTYEVSILLSPEFWRRGIGKEALTLAKKLKPGFRLYAEVLSENKASRTLFKAVGFTQIKGRAGHYILDN